VIRLAQALNTWGTSDFEGVLKQEVEKLEGKLLPLQQALSTTSVVAESPHHVRIICITADDRFIHVKAGIQYAGIIAGCSCADDPTPVDEVTEYCEVQLVINKTTAETVITLAE
jgi:hypothetical protein